MVSPVRRGPEVQDIFRIFKDRILESLTLSKVQYKAFNSITACRTVKLGGHGDTCPECGYTKISYNSCRNRSCPKCGALARDRWLERRLSSILDVQHLHVVFTVPQQLYAIGLANGPAFHGLMFSAASETVLEACRTRGFIPGFSAVLHTWSQTMAYHPHIHMPVTAGGLSLDGQGWRSAGRKQDGTFYLAPVRVLSRLFRGKLVSAIRAAHKEGKISFDSRQLSSILDEVMRIEWVVYAKEPFKGAQMVYRYLGRYTHRTAISNSRIKEVDEAEGTVVFSYRDYADESKEKLMKLDAVEFARRFMLHVPETGFTRIRHYGLYGSASVKRRKTAAEKTATIFRKPEKLTVREFILKVYDYDIEVCPHCGFHLHTRPVPRSNSP